MKPFLKTMPPTLKLLDDLQLWMMADKGVVNAGNDRVSTWTVQGPFARVLTAEGSDPLIVLNMMPGIKTNSVNSKPGVSFINVTGFINAMMLNGGAIPALDLGLYKATEGSGHN